MGSPAGPARATAPAFAAFAALVAVLAVLPAGLATHVATPPYPPEAPCTGAVFFDDFEAEPVAPGAVVSNYNGFAKWDVAAGAVDLLGSDPPGFMAVYDSISVDMDGTTNNGGTLRSKTSVTWAAGEQVTVQWLRAGNQRQSPSDTLTVSLGPWSKAEYLSFDAPWGAVSDSFTAATAGSGQVLLYNPGDDLRGALVDNVRVCVRLPASTGSSTASTTTTAPASGLNRPPAFQPLASQVARAGEQLCFRVHASDPDGDPVAYEARDLPAGASFAPDGLFCWKPSTADLGDHCALGFMATDGKGGFGQASACIRVVSQATDRDQDGVEDPADDCPGVADYDQRDSDGDGAGDACDPTPCGPGATGGACAADGVPAATSAQAAADRDGDGVHDRSDNCPTRANHDQRDGDLDGLGDACDVDADGDDVVDRAAPGDQRAFVDNCPSVPNGDQADADLDGVGDACQDAAAGLAMPAGCVGCATGRPAAATPPRPAPAAWVAVAFLALVGAAALASWRGRLR